MSPKGSVEDYTYTDYESQSLLEGAAGMSFESVITITVGVFGGLAAFSLVQLGAIRAWAFYRATFHEPEKERLYRGLAWVFPWAVVSVFLSLDFRTTPEIAQYAAIGISLILVLTAYVIISLNLGPKSGFGDWRTNASTLLSSEEQRRQGVASDTLAVLWFFLALIVGVNSAVITARLVAYRFDEHWFRWLLS